MMTETELFRGERGERGTERRPFHIRLSDKHRRKLVALSRKLRLTGADVIRALLDQA